MYRLGFTLSFLLLTSCAYRFGYSERSLPGGYTEVAVPIFKNKSMEVGVETFFTNSMIRQIERSNVAKVSSRSEAPVKLLGTIEKVEYIATAQKSLTSPSNTVITTEYRIKMDVLMELKKNSNGQILWQSRFSEEKVYSAPQISVATLNSANPLYNHSARLQNIQLMAEDLMEQAHDRMTENF